MLYLKYIYLFSLSIILIISACKKEEPQTREYSILSVLWQQNAAEYKALTLQSYNLAKFQLEKSLSENINKTGKYAVVADIDETVLDNSPFDAKLIQLNTNYNKELWYSWCELRQAEPIPGALTFFKYAASKGVEVFYISNRDLVLLGATVDNLKKFDFPYADNNHVLLRDSTSAKEPRRLFVKNTHEILLLLGDNLSDFTDLFDNQGTSRRNVLVDSLKDSFGPKFIIFPNPIYGDWETKGLYEGKYDWTHQQLDSLRHSKLKLY